jgi:hypothetical protein
VIGVLCIALGPILVASTQSAPALETPGNDSLPTLHWSVTQSPSVHISSTNGSDASLDSVSCPTPKFCVAVGRIWNRALSYVIEPPLVEIYNGNTWKRVFVSRRNAQMLGVACPSSRYCLAVGDTTSNASGPLAEIYQNGDWRPTIPTKSNVRLNSVACPMVSRCIAIGIDYRTQRIVSFALIDTRWHQLAVQSALDFVGGVESLDSISCPTLSFCEAVGYASSGGPNSQRLSAHFNGRYWMADEVHHLTSAYVSGFDSVSCSSIRYCILLGSEATTPWHGASTPFANIAESLKKSVRTPIVTTTSLPSTKTLEVVTCIRDDSCVFVGSQKVGALVDAYVNGRFTTEAAPFYLIAANDTTSFQAVSCPAASFCVAVGELNNFPVIMIGRSE